MGRYKLGPQGAYYDPNDSGPDQASPDQIAALQGPSASVGPGPQRQVTDPNAPGFDPGFAGNRGQGPIGQLPWEGYTDPVRASGQPPFEKFPGYQRPPFPVDRGMGHIIDTGAQPPSDYWQRTIDWNDPASVWGGWTRNGQPLDPNNPHGGLF